MSAANALSHTPLLFSPLQLRTLEISNRIIVSPMCQYSCVEGIVNHWHLVHLGSRAVGGAGLVFTEAAAVSAVGRISAADAGIWNDAHVAAWQPITDFVKSQGATVGIQLAHAGRKASVAAPWTGRGVVPPSEPDGWEPLGPSAIAFPKYNLPHQLSVDDIHAITQQFIDGAKRALTAGFDTVEIHAAHGYLLHQFLSPLANQRADEYGGSLENRIRFPLQVCNAVRAVWPEALPIFLRISATDWVEGGFTIDEAVEFCKQAKSIGVDMIGVSTSGNALAHIPTAPGYQVPFSSRIRTDANIATYAVGLISEAMQAESILGDGKADAVALARGLLRDPYWPRHAARELGYPMPWPDQYKRCEVDAYGKAL